MDYLFECRKCFVHEGFPALSSSASIRYFSSDYVLRSLSEIRNRREGSLQHHHHFCLVEFIAQFRHEWFIRLTWRLLSLLLGCRSRHWHSLRLTLCLLGLSLWLLFRLPRRYPHTASVSDDRFKHGIETLCFEMTLTGIWSKLEILVKVCSWASSSCNFFKSTTYAHCKLWCLSPMFWVSLKAFPL